MKKETHVDRVLRYLKDFGSITSLDAIREFGNTRLSATIYILRHDYNLPIKSKMEVSKNRYGEKTEYARYYIDEKDDDEKGDNDERSDN